MPHHHYIEIITHQKSGKLTTRIPMEDFEESKRAAFLLATEFFPEDPDAQFACARGVYHYDSINDHGEKVTIQPMISPLSLSTGESMNEAAVSPKIMPYKI